MKPFDKFVDYLEEQQYASTIYSHIKQTDPDISDTEAAKIFNIAYAVSLTMLREYNDYCLRQ